MREKFLLIHRYLYIGGAWPGVARRLVTFFASPKKVTKERGTASREQGSRLRDATDRESVPDAEPQCLISAYGVAPCYARHCSALRRRPGYAGLRLSVA